jgi:S1-C subfamily serine protease
MSGSGVGTRVCRDRGVLVIALAAAVVVVGHARGAYADPGHEAEEVRAAVVKIFTTHQVPLYLDPWSPGWVYSASGSGCVVAGHRILTNAHVVGNATLIQVRRYGQADRHTARVLFVSHEADLALLTVDAAGFFDGVKPLPLGTLPPLQQEVSALGYPEGGDSLSITRGVLSRIEHISYIHNYQTLLGGQIDAALNPGNSGGPVIVDGCIVGIAMQIIPASQNIAYMVPTPVIEQFLADVADGHQDGVPQIGILYQKMQNADLRRRYGLTAAQTGVLVTATPPGFASSELLKPGDVLLSVGGRPVASDGTIEFRPQERTSFAFSVESLQIGQTIPVEVLRDGRLLSLVVPLNGSLTHGALVPPPQYDQRPSYFVFGGLVFMPLTTDYLAARNYGSHDLMALMAKAPTFEGEEVVVLARVLAAEVNEGYHEIFDGVVKTVDGVKPRNLADLVRLVETGTGPFVTITYDEEQRLVLDRANALAAGKAIMERYSLAADRYPAPEGAVTPAQP